MTSTVRDLVKAADLEYGGVVRWGKPVPCARPGVYVVGLDPDPASAAAGGSPPPISTAAVDRLLALRPELTLDGMRPTAEELTRRLGRFWLSDEVVLYVGLAGTSTLAGRVGAYYTTELGARAPHAGGWFLKTLTPNPPRWVHWAQADDPALAEDRMLAAFCNNVSKSSLHTLLDAEHPFPFANLEWPKGIRKRHGILGAKAPKMAATGSNGPPARPRPLPATPARPRPIPAPPARPFETDDTTPSRPLSGSLLSQQVTAKDRLAGQIRIPQATKSIFPPQAAVVSVSLRGRQIEGRWTPRTGPDRERSGLLRVGRHALSDSVPVGTRLVVTALPRGGIELT